MRSLLIVAMLLASGTANAGTYYFIDNKPVTRAEAMQKSLATPEIKIVRVKVDQVYVNKDSGRFKRGKDLPYLAIPYLNKDHAKVQ